MIFLLVREKNLEYEKMLIFVYLELVTTQIYSAMLSLKIAKHTFVKLANPQIYLEADSLPEKIESPELLI